MGAAADHLTWAMLALGVGAVGDLVGTFQGRGELIFVEEKDIGLGA